MWHTFSNLVPQLSNHFLLKQVKIHYHEFGQLEKGKQRKDAQTSLLKRNFKKNHKTENTQKITSRRRGSDLQSNRTGNGGKISRNYFQTKFKVIKNGKQY